MFIALAYLIVGYHITGILLMIRFKNGPNPCIHLLAHVLDVPVPSPCVFDSFSFPMSPCETENSYFDTQTYQMENTTNPITTNSRFTVYVLFLIVITRIGPPCYPMWSWPIALDLVKHPSSYLPLNLTYYIYTYTLIIHVHRTSHLAVLPGSKIIKMNKPKKLMKQFNLRWKLEWPLYYLLAKLRSEKLTDKHNDGHYRTYNCNDKHYVTCYRNEKHYGTTVMTKIMALKRE